MLTIADTLNPDRVKLGIEVLDHIAARLRVAALLENTSEVLDWKTLVAGLMKSSPCLSERGSNFAICLPHFRTDSVTAMVMSVGRIDQPLFFPDTELPVRYIFCIGVPTAMNSDYLRILGLLARILKDPTAEEHLRTARTEEAFIEGLSALEAKL